MSHKLIRLGFFSVAVALALLITYAQPLFTAQPVNPSIGTKSTASTAPPSVVAKHLLPSLNDVDKDPDKSRNLTLQPEALKLSRRIGGKRFKAKARSTLTLEGLLNTATGQQGIQIVRAQDARGERVETRLSPDSTSLVWTEVSGFHSLGRSLTPSDRALIERLTFDSVDYFILAQLRGASYYVVARNVRSERAEDYDESGPRDVWDVIRVNDPEEDPEKKPLSRWRLYYLSPTTGLIDKIISEVSGERIEAHLSGWREQAGEKFPTKITWSNQSGVLMTLTLTKVLVTQH